MQSVISRRPLQPYATSLVTALILVLTFASA
jgi:hypothetical protein